MNNLRVLQEKRLKLMNDAAKLSRQENYTAENRTQVLAMLADVDVLDADIATEERISKFEADQRSSTRPPRPGFSVEQEDDIEKRNFSDFIRFGKSEQRDLGVGPISGSITGGSQFVPQTFDPLLTSARKAIGQVISAVTMRKTDTGAPMKFALENDTTAGFTVVPEGATAVAQDPSFGSGVSNVDKIMTTTTATFEELQDSYFDIDAFVREKFFNRYLRSVSQLIVQGSSTGNVQSIVSTATSVGSSSDGNALGYLDLLRLRNALDPDYLANASWLMNSATLGSLLGVLDSLGRPIFLPSVTAGAPDTILGRPVLMGQQLDLTAPGKTPVLFGHMAEGYVLRVVGGIQVLRLDQIYAQSGRIGFTGWTRVGGNARDGGTHPILSLQMKSS